MPLATGNQKRFVPIYNDDVESRNDDLAIAALARFADGRSFTELRTMTPDGKDAKRLGLTGAAFTAERDPAVSPDGKSIVFAGERDGHFDLWRVPVTGGATTAVTNDDGDERWPSVLADGRVVFAHRAPHGTWRLESTVAGGFGPGADRKTGPTGVRTDAPVILTTGEAAEWRPRVSPDGKWVAFVSNRESDSGEIDIWVRELQPADAGKPRTIRVTRTTGAESAPTWAPDSKRIAYALGLGAQAATWVATVPTTPAAPTTRNSTR